MRVRLQHYLHRFGPQAANLFDLDFWKTATDLRSFGVELRVFSGFVEVELRTFPPGQQPRVLDRLSQAGAGSKFSPPYFPSEMSDPILPVVVQQSEDADFFLYFGTNDQPPQAWPKVCFVTEDIGTQTHVPQFERFLYSAGDGRGPDAHLLTFGATAPHASHDPRMHHLQTPSTGTAALQQVMGDLAFGRLAEQNFTHLCFLEADRPVHPEMLARMVELSRFIKPEFYGAAGAYLAEDWDGPGTVTAGSGIGPTSDAIWPFNILSEGLALEQISELTTAERHPSQPIPGLICLSISDMISCGLPDPQIRHLPLLEYLTRLAAHGRRPAVPLSLSVARMHPWQSDMVAQLAPVWRDALMTLAIRGELSDDRQIGTRLRELSKALPDMPRRKASAVLASEVPGVFGQDGNARGLLGKLWEGHIAMPSPKVPNLAQRAAQLAEQNLQAANPLKAQERGLSNALWQAFAVTQKRMDNLRTELLDQAHRTAMDVDAQLNAIGIADAARTRADLERASILPLAGLYRRHKGQRAIIVGNGPSLTYADLTRLQGEVTFGSNKIFLSFEHTEWRPTYYSVEDHLVLTNNMDSISRQRGMKKLFPSNMRDYGFHDPDTIFIPRIPPKSWEAPLSDPDFPQFSFDLIEGLHWGSTIVYSQIQMAVFMGCTEIYLIGLDHAYQVSGEKQVNTYVGKGERNHFHPDYRTAGERWHQPNLEVLEVSYQRAFDVCTAQGIGIYNASRTTQLETFPKVNFDEIFSV